MEPLLELRCAGCSRHFAICRRDYRGQKYCSASCREVTRKRKLAEYERRYRTSLEGRLNRADLERARRERAREADRISSDDVFSKFVDDHTSALTADFDTVSACYNVVWHPSASPLSAHVVPFRGRIAARVCRSGAPDTYHGCAIALEKGTMTRSEACRINAVAPLPQNVCSGTERAIIRRDLGLFAMPVVGRR